MKRLKKWILKWYKTLSISFIISGIGIYFPSYSFAQQLNLPLNHTFSVDLDRELLQSDMITHTAFKPLLQSAIEPVIANDSSFYLTNVISRRYSRSFVSRKLFYEHLISLDTGVVKLTIDPLLNFEFGNEFDDDPRDISLYKNTRGFNVKILLGNKVAIESSFRENQANLPQYLSYRVQETGEAYGQGRVKTFKDSGFDFAMASAYLSYSPNNRVNIQAGHGKHSVGSGYRSLLLSDLSFNYPFLKVNSNWFNNKLQYQNLYSLFQDLERLNSGSSSEGLFQRKQGVFHFLEYSPNSKLSIGLFEGVIFPSLDTTGNISVGANYWVPIIFLNTIVEGSKNTGNSVLGTNLSLRALKQIELYNQFSIADENFSKLGLQLGFKWYFLDYFMLQGEFNKANKSQTQNLYTHYNQYLNNPLQNDANELIGIIHFQKNRWQSRLKVNSITNAQPDVSYIDFRQAFIVNPSYNFTLHIGAQYRNQTYEVENAIQPHTEFVNMPYNNSSFYVYFGLSTNLQNIYFDY